MEEPKPPAPSDGALAIAATLGDLESFGALAQRYRRAVVRIASAIAGPENAEDIAQDVFLLAFQALPDLDEPDRFAAWISAIARNRSRRWLHTERRMPRVPFDDTFLRYIDALTVRDKRLESATAGMVEEIGRLPENVRLVMRLRWLDEMPVARVAAFTGLPVSTVKWRLHEGKRILQQLELRKDDNQHDTNTGNGKIAERAAPHGQNRADEPMERHQRGSR